MSMEKVFVKDLFDKQVFESVFLIKDLQKLKDKNGKVYLSVTLADISGTIDGRVWDNAEDLSNRFSSGQFALVKGHVQNYQNRLQVVIHTVAKAENVNFSDYVKSSEKDPKEMLGEVISIVREHVKGEHVSRLLLETLERNDISELLKVTPAAKSIHHAYVGGLIEHILSISKIMIFLGDHYPFLKKDYLIFGAIYHDLGKIWELSVVDQISYTDRGRLIGHLHMACELLDEQCQKILGFPLDVRDHLKHIILSHHGRLEYGSPKRPKFLEALVVSMVDELDSRVSCLKDFMDSELQYDQSWSRYNGLFDRYFLLDILKDQIDE